MDILELKKLRMELVLSNLLDGPIPQYWERDVPPDVKTVADWHAKFGHFSEEEAERLLQEWVGKTAPNRWNVRVPVLAIITSEPWGDYVDSKGVAQPGAHRRFATSTGGASAPDRATYNRFMAVESVERRETPVYIDLPDGMAKKVNATVWTATSEPYDMPDGRTGLRDYTRSGSERFVINDDGSVEQFGAATALLARLLEVVTD